MQDQLSNIAEFFDALTSNEISQLRAAHDELMSLPPEDLADLSDALDAVAVNPDLYPALKRAAAEAGDDSLPAEYNPQAISILNAVTKSAVGSMTRKPMRSGGIAGIHPTDTITAHITPGEALLLESRGGAGTVNPMTGNREYFLKNIGKIFKKVGKTLKKAAPLILSIGATAVLGPAGLGLSPMVAGAVGSGLSTLVTGGSPEDALKSAAIGGAVGFAAGKLGLAGGETASSAPQGTAAATTAKGTAAAKTADTVRALAPKGSTVAAPTEGGITASLTDKASDFWQNTLSPNRAMPTPQDITGSDAFQQLRAQGVSPDTAFKTVSEQMTPSAFSRYAPLAALGVGALALTGGFDEEEAAPTANDLYMQRMQNQQQQLDQMLAADPQALSIFGSSPQGGISMAAYQPPSYITDPSYRVAFKKGGFGGDTNQVGDFGDLDPAGMKSMSAAKAQRDGGAGADRAFQEKLAERQKRDAKVAQYSPQAPQNDNVFGEGGKLHRWGHEVLGLPLVRNPELFNTSGGEGPMQAPPPPAYRPPIIPPGWTPQGYEAANPDLSQYLSQYPGALQGQAREQWLQQHWLSQGARQNRPFAPAQQLQSAQGLFSSLRGATGALDPESSMYSDPYQGGLASLSIQRTPMQAGGLPTSMVPGQSGDPLWEQIMGREYQKHIQGFGRDWNTRKTSPAERAAQLARMQTSYVLQRQAMAPRPAAPRPAAPSSSSSSASAPSVAAGYPGGIGELPGARPLYPGADAMLPPPPQYVHQIPNVSGVPYSPAGAGFTNALNEAQQYYSALNAGADPFIINAAERVANEGITMAAGGSPKMQLPDNNNQFRQTPVGPRINGQVQGPGTDTSDNIAAALSPNEFVFTARAVRGAGDGDMNRGIQAMYDLMHGFEQRA